RTSAGAASAPPPVPENRGSPSCGAAQRLVQALQGEHAHDDAGVVGEDDDGTGAARLGGGGDPGGAGVLGDDTRRRQHGGDRAQRRLGSGGGRDLGGHGRVDEPADPARLVGEDDAPARGFVGGGDRGPGGQRD